MEKPQVNKRRSSQRTGRIEEDEIRSLTVCAAATTRSPKRDMRPGDAGHYVPVELEVSRTALTLPQRSATVMDIRPAAHLSQPT